MRFVLHHHTDDKAHYDLMIEIDGTAQLSTWRISENEFHSFLDGAEITAEKIQDHRREYLTYEGPVSNNRGHVKIFDSGSYQTIPDKDISGISLSGKKLKGIIRFRNMENNLTRIVFSQKTD